MMTAPTIYYAVVNLNGDFLLNWQTDSAPIVRYLYQHPQAKLLICHESPDNQDDCSIVATIEPQLTVEDIGLAPSSLGASGSRLIATLDATLGQALDADVDNFGSAHAKRLAYLSLYYAQLKSLSRRDTIIMILSAYLHDFGADRDGQDGGYGLSRFNRYLDGHGIVDPELIHAKLTMILKRAHLPWSSTDSQQLMYILADSRVTGWTRHLQDWTHDIRLLDQLRFGRSVVLTQLHDYDAMRLLFISQQELNLIPDSKTKEILI